MPEDENSDLFPKLVAAVPPPLVAPTEPVTSIQAAALDRHSASKPARSAPLPSSGQLILGADQRNPLLTVYHDEEHQQLRVYYGFEIIEIVPDDTQAGSYKLLMGPFRRSVETPKTSSPNGWRHSGWERPILNKPSSSIGRIWK